MDKIKCTLTYSIKGVSQVQTCQSVMESGTEGSIPAKPALFRAAMIGFDDSDN